MASKSMVALPEGSFWVSAHSKLHYYKRGSPLRLQSNNFCDLPNIYHKLNILNQSLKKYSSRGAVVDPRSLFEKFSSFGILVNCPILHLFNCRTGILLCTLFIVVKLQTLNNSKIHDKAAKNVSGNTTYHLKRWNYYLWLLRKTRRT